MVKKKLKVIIAGALMCSLLFGQGFYTVNAEAAEDNTNITTTAQVNADTRLNDDFYNTVNYGWLHSAQIPEGMTSNSSFYEAYENVNNQKKEIMKDLLENEKDYAEDSDEKRIINFYKNVLNMDARNKQGAEAVKEIIKEVNDIKSVKDISNLGMDSNLTNSLIGMGISTDTKDSNKKALYVISRGLTLGNPDDYTEPTENSKKTKQIIENYYTNILKLSGYSEEAAKAKIDNLFKFENMIAPYMIGREQTTKDDKLQDKLYNVYTLDELDKLAPNLDIKTIAKNFKYDTAKKIILKEPKWLEGLNKIYTDENLQMFKDTIEVNTIVGISNLLGKDFQDATTAYANAYTGSKGSLSQEDKAINMVSSVFSEQFGRLYAERYCSKSVKDDVTEMTEDIIAAYKNRIKNLDWMSDATKEKAIEKLDKMKLKIAYPDKFDDFNGVEIKTFEEGGSLVENYRNLTRYLLDKEIDEMNDDVDKTKFSCPPQTVNAFYSPTQNSVTIPAGILQGAFYNENNNREKNLGGIGAVIGHEISHAFDNNGSNFDCDGNLNNWWTAEDYKNFKEKTDKVRAYYSTVKTDSGSNVNGDLTVGENISDLGGVACTLDIMNKMDNPNYKDFFESQAKVWRMICTPEAAELTLKMDVHSPNKVRSNVVVAQFEEFYKTYGIKPGDKMYVKPEDRLKVW